MAADSRGLFIARESALVSVDGQDVAIHAGHTIVAAGHPMLVGREHMFMPLTVHYDMPGQQPEPPQLQSPASRSGSVRTRQSRQQPEQQRSS